MTHKEENIVNISMMAADLLKEGRIEPDNITGFVGMTEHIISLAEQFEEKFAGVDFDAEGRFYLEEIDKFAEAQLLDMFGVEHVPEKEPLSIKVIIDEGVVEAVLKDQNVPVNVEVVPVYSDYEDYEQLKDYRSQLYADKSFVECDYTSAHFKDEPDFVIEDPVQVRCVSAGGVWSVLFTGDFDECLAFCNENNWSYLDENRFQWELEIYDEREKDFPEDYGFAVSHYSEIVDEDIENEFVRQHAEELTFCYKNGKDIADFDFWTRYEQLLCEKLSYDEYYLLDAAFDINPMEIEVSDGDVISQWQTQLEKIRAMEPEKEPFKVSLADQIKSAQNRTGESDIPSGIGKDLEK